MTDLKPCPFCGGPASADADEIMRYVDEEGKNSTIVLFSVGCINCGCKTYRYSKMESAIEAWNRRADT